MALLLSVSGRVEASQDAAKRYFQNGVELITAAQPNYQDAYYQFQLAYQESSKSWKVLGNLGLCALKLERDQEAVTYYEQYLKKGGSEIAPEERAAIEQDLLLLKGNLATVRITSAVQDLKVVDRRAGSQAPAQSYALEGGELELKLRAGNHNLSATSGNKRLNWDVVLEPKSVATHEFDFDEPPPPPAPVAVAAAPATPPPPASDKAQSRGADLRIPAYISLGLGAVGVGLGGFFAWQSQDYNSQADDVFACDDAKTCTPEEEIQVRQLEADRDAATTRAIVAFSAGGVAVVAGIVLLAVSSSPPSTATRSVTPFVGLREVGVSGRF
ncbi:MAG TPA: hypothetical protein VIW29_07580 [Polyangiaceae bacterium]